MPTYAPANSSEFEGFLQLMHETAGYLEPSLKLLGMTPSQFGELFRTVGRVFSVREESELAGFFWIERRDNVLHLHGLILRPQFRGKGIGTQIVKHLELEYRDCVDAIELGVHVSNAGAIRLYERLGFETLRFLNDVGFQIMQKRLYSHESL